MGILNEIALRYGTDKSSEVHNYCEKYSRYLPFNRDEFLKILEIGVFNGSSLRMWADYFFSSTIIGIDINPECKIHEDAGISVEIGSQVDEQFLNRVVDKYKDFDLIIDDGSHRQSHIIRSFEILFPYLKSKGIYVIEDTCCAYWPKYEGGYRKPGTVIEYFKNLVDDVNFNGMESQPVKVARREDWLIEKVKEKKLKIRTDIESIVFLNSMIMIFKR